MSDIAEVYSSCGRFFLFVVGIPVAMQGDKCRANLPVEYLDPIPEEELESSYIGDKRAKGLPLEVVHFFRGNDWTKKMLDYVANQIDAAAKENK